MATRLPPSNDNSSSNGSDPGQKSSSRPTPNQDSGAYRILTVAGIPVRIHWTFLAMLAFLAFSGVGSNAEQPGRLPFQNVLFFLGLFACVVLHELGHALTALRYGIHTHDITLYPIGGVARLESMPRPREELWIALAGPAVNVVIAGLLYLGLTSTGQPVGRFAAQGTSNLLVNWFWANVVLVAFNLIPAFPMDGGRVLRALIARTTDEATATAIAARIGQFIAILFGLFGLLSMNLLLIFIAIFVYTGAAQEATAYQARVLTEGHSVREAMLRDFRTLGVGNSLREAADALLAGSQQDFPVMHGDQVEGVLSRAALLRGMAAEGPDSYVAGVMERDFERAQPDDALETILTQMQALQNGPILVMEGEDPEDARLIGMLTQENLLEFLMLTQLQSRPRNN